MEIFIKERGHKIVSFLGEEWRPSCNSEFRQRTGEEKIRFVSIKDCSLLDMSFKCRECLRSLSLSTESDQNLIQINHSNSSRCHFIQEVFCTTSCQEKWKSIRCAKCFCDDDLVQSKENGLLYCSTSMYEKDQTCLDSHLGFYRNCVLCGYMIRDGKEERNGNEDEVGIEEKKTRDPWMCNSCFEGWEEKQLELTKMLRQNFCMKAIVTAKLHGLNGEEMILSKQSTTNQQLEVF
jgi:hypothetical protein